MDIFVGLLLGHLVGDWVLQNDWMAAGKKRGVFTVAGTVHFVLYACSTIGFLCLFTSTERGARFYLMLGAMIIASHWIIDATDIVERWMRFYGQSKEFVRIMVDQTLHLLVLVSVAAFWSRM